MPSYTKFKELLSLGQKYEDEAIIKICNLYNVSVIERQNETNYKIIHYDIKTDDNKTYEIKADIKSNLTNNFFIEYSQYNKQSGILITQAQYHILIHNELFYCIETDKIKKLIEIKHYRTASTRDGLSKGFLIPVSDIIKNSVVI